MKLNKIIALAGVCVLAGGAFAQTFELHGGVDFTTYGVTQQFVDNNGTKDNSDAQASFNPDGEITVDMRVAAGNFEFNTGLYFNANGGDDEYTDFANGYGTTPFYKGNMKISFFNDQFRVYTGKFEKFNAGYIENGYVLGAQSITNLADSKYGQHLTALEVQPYAVPGFKFIAGLPILPVSGNGISESTAANQWKNLYKKFKLAASYTLPVEALPATVNVGFRPGTYYDGVSAALATLTTDFTESQFGEGYIQFAIPSLADFLALNLSYDIRYRNSSYENTLGETVNKTALSHMVGVSGKMNLLENLSLAVEDRFYFFGDDYLLSDEKMLYDVLAVNTEFGFAGKPFACGIDLAGFFAADANGTSFFMDKSTASIQNVNYVSDKNIDLTRSDMATADVSNLAGDPTTYIGFYANPYFKVNFSNGALKLGAEVSYTNFFNANVNNTGFSYRVPVGLTFAF